jgi:hypothetical protein
LVRAWGLVYCARPCISVTCCFVSDPEYYDKNVSLRARQFAAENPNDAIDLCKLVVNKGNYGAMHAFIAKMKALETEGDDRSRNAASEQSDERQR